MPARSRSRPFSARFSPGRPSHLGPPMAPSSTLSLARHLSSSDWGRGSPQASMASPPIRTFV